MKVKILLLSFKIFISIINEHSRFVPIGTYPTQQLLSLLLLTSI